MSALARSARMASATPGYWTLTTGCSVPPSDPTRARRTWPIDAAAAMAPDPTRGTRRRVAPSSRGSPQPPARGSSAAHWPGDRRGPDAAVRASRRRGSRHLPELHQRTLHPAEAGGDVLRGPQLSLAVERLDRSALRERLRAAVDAGPPDPRFPETGQLGVARPAEPTEPWTIACRCLRRRSTTLASMVQRGWRAQLPRQRTPSRAAPAVRLITSPRDACSAACTLTRVGRSARRWIRRRRDRRRCGTPSPGIDSNRRIWRDRDDVSRMVSRTRSGRRSRRSTRDEASDRPPRLQDLGPVVPADPAPSPTCRHWIAGPVDA